jgi:hypothetical protein
MGLFRRERQPETIAQIIDRVIRESGGTPPPLPPGAIGMVNPAFARKVAKEVKRAKDHGLLIEDEAAPSTPD